MPDKLKKCIRCKKDLKVKESSIYKCCGLEYTLHKGFILIQDHDSIPMIASAISLKDGK